MLSEKKNPSLLFYEALKAEKPLQIVGTINAMSALLAQKAGFKAIYLSGAGLANNAYGLPDLGMTNLNNILDEVYRITDAVSLPLLVDIDTGFGNVLQIARSIKLLIKAGAAAVHIEDQVAEKRCGHRPGKQLVSTIEMVDRLKAAVDARENSNFIIMARTDALASEGLNHTLDRIQHYSEAGADMIFFEGVTSLDQYQTLTQQCKIPVLANITEFGVTPLFTKEELARVGVQMILYPVSAARCMNYAAEMVYTCIREQGTQKNMLDKMQTREELYKILDYHTAENKLDELFSKGKEK